MSYGRRATWDTIRELAFGDISFNYAVIGTATTKQVRIVKVTNATDETLYFSDDGVNDKLKLPTNSYQLWDITTNKALSDKPQFIDIGTKFYVRSTSDLLNPSSGWVSIELLITEIGA